jgi:hypothetical protein
MSEKIVERFEPVEIEEEGGHRAGTARFESLFHMFEQRPPIRQPGQIVVQRDISQSFFGNHARLQLGEERGDRLEHIQFPGAPVAIALFDESQHAGRLATRQQRHRGHRDLWDARGAPDRLLIVGGLLRRPHDDRLGGVFQFPEYRIGMFEMHDLQRVRIRYITTVRPFRDEHGRPLLSIGMAQVAEIDIEMLDQPGQHTFTRRHHRCGVDAHQLRGDLGHQ